MGASALPPLSSYDFPAYFDILLKYTYQPFSSINNGENRKVDTRTYFWVRGFLDEMVEQGCTHNFKLTFTWFHFASESEVKKQT